MPAGCSTRRRPVQHRLPVGNAWTFFCLLWFRMDWIGEQTGLSWVQAMTKHVWHIHTQHGNCKYPNTRCNTAIECCNSTKTVHIPKKNRLIRLVCFSHRSTSKQISLRDKARKIIVYWWNNTLVSNKLLVIFPAKQATYAQLLLPLMWQVNSVVQIRLEELALPLPGFLLICLFS